MTAADSLGRRKPGGCLCLQGPVVKGAGHGTAGFSKKPHLFCPVNVGHPGRLVAGFYSLTYFQLLYII